MNFVFQERGKSYLRLLCGTNGERISSTHEAHRPSRTRSAISRRLARGNSAATGALQGFIRVQDRNLLGTIRQVERSCINHKRRAGMGSDERR